MVVTSNILVSLDKNFAKPSYLGITGKFGGKNFTTMVKVATSS